MRKYSDIKKHYKLLSSLDSKAASITDQMKHNGATVLFSNQKKKDVLKDLKKEIMLIRNDINQKVTDYAALLKIVQNLQTYFPLEGFE